MPEFTLFEKIIIWSVPVIFGITVHEVAHGWLANKLGDPTAKIQGRLTLNPIKHIDPIGTLVVPAILLYVSNFVLGWARPVPVNWNNLRHPRRDMALVAAAGPGANLVMLIVWFILAKLFLVASLPIATTEILLVMCEAGIIINIILMILNMLPLLPLDGGRVMSALLPIWLSRYYARLEPFGLLIIILLLVTGLLQQILGPPVFGLYSFVVGLLQG